MKITDVRAVQPPTPDSPEDWRTWLGQILVRLDTDEGVTGYGVGGGGAAGIHVVQTVLHEVLVGEDPTDVEGFWERMYRHTLPYGQKGLAMMAISGVDLALWDVRGKRAEKPLVEVLGGQAGVVMPAYRTGWSPEEVAQGRDEGYHALKLHTGYEALRDASLVPIAGGEHEYTAKAFEVLMKDRLHSVLQPDVCWCGGMTELVKIYELQKKYGGHVCPHRGSEVWALHAIAALDPEPLAESGRPWIHWVHGQPEIVDGKIQLGNAPGFGVTFDDSLWDMET